MKPVVMTAEPHEGRAAVRVSPVKRHLLIVGSHVVQYSSPIFQKLAKDPRIEIRVAYCSMQGAMIGMDPGFGIEISWDTQVLEGYPWIEVPNRALRPGLGRFFGLFNPGLWNLISKGKFDVVLVSGYFYASAWIAILSAKWHGIPVIFTTDGHSLRTWASQTRWKTWLKRHVIRRIYALGAVVLAGSSGTVEFLQSLGISKDQIILSGNIIDNDWWTERASRADRDAIRASWKIPALAPTVLFCAKFQPWKGPLDLLEAFARANVPDAYLVFAGEGPLRKEIEEKTRSLGLSERVRLLGFVNQSQLPSVYRAADLLVLPSLYEPFGFVVNEAMLCGCPAAVSDRVGAKYDLVREGETGYEFPAGDINALAAVLEDFVSDTDKVIRMGEAARERMKSWSPAEYVNALAEAVDLAVRSRP